MTTADLRFPDDEERALVGRGLALAALILFSPLVHADDTGTQVSMSTAAEGDRAQDLAALQIPEAHTSAKIQAARDCVQSRGGADEVARDHQVDFRTHSDPVGVEAILRWGHGVLGDEFEPAVELRDLFRAHFRGGGLELGA